MTNTYEEYMKELDDMLEPDIMFSFAELQDKKKDELVELCKTYELKVSGNKPDLIQRIMEYQTSNVISAGSEITFVRKDSNEELSGNTGDPKEPAKAERI